MLLERLASGAVAGVLAFTLAGPAHAAIPAVSGLVWADRDRDGIRDRGEPATRGVTVRLERRSGKTWKASRTTKTTKGGRYRLALPTGSGFRIVAVAPVGQTFTARQQGSSRAKDSDVDQLGASARFSRKARVLDVGLVPRPATLTTPTASTVPATAPEVVPAVVPGPGGTVAGTVWRETTVDGRRDPGEPAAPPSVVQLWNAERTELLATTTSASTDGRYTLALPTAQTAYRVRVALPAGAAGYTQVDAAATDTDDSDVIDVGTEVGFSQPFVATGAANTIDAGLRFLPPVTITGRAWRDINNDGYRSDSETEASASFEVWTADRTQRLATAPTLAGAYTLVAPYGGISVRLRAVLTHGAVGRYRTFADPARDSDFYALPSADAGWSDPFALPASGGTLSTFDLAFVEQISIGDFVWNDTDNDGIQEQGEPGLEGVSVEIWDDARAVLLDRTTTDALGKYVVRVRGAGDYALRVMKPSGLWRFSPREAGASPTLDSNVDSTGWADVEIQPSLISTPTFDAGLSRITLTLGP